MKKLRLKKLLNHRCTMETLAQQELAIVQQLKEKLQLEVATVQELLTASGEEFEEHQRTGLTCQELLLYQEHLNRQTKQLAERQHQLAMTCHDVDDRLERLVEASKDKRLLEKLKEKQDAEFQRILLRQENIVLDEIAIQQFHKR